MAANKKVAAQKGTAKKAPSKKSVTAKTGVKVAKKSLAATDWNLPANTVISAKRGGKLVTAILKGPVTVEIVSRGGQFQSVKAAPAKKAAAGKMPTRYDVDPPDKTKKKRM